MDVVFQEIMLDTVIGCLTVVSGSKADIHTS